MKLNDSPRKFRSAFKFLTAFGLLSVCASAQAAVLTNWTQSAGSNGSSLNTSSPVLGNGTSGSGSNQQIWAATPSSYTLASVGDMLVLSGVVTFNLSAAAGSDQFRFGLYSSNGNTGANGWLGYFASNSGSGANPNGRLWERDAGNTTAFGSNGTGSATQRMAVAGVPTNSFLSGTYNLSLSATRTDTGLSVAWSIIGTGGTTYSISGTYVDTTALTYGFDRVGIFTGGGLNANQASFSNMDITYTAVPEPHSFALLAGSGLVLGVFHRRRRLANA